ncbi:MAG TPA: DUF433 domain-containing protein [Thermoanaerobaculia bacterium]|jgi:uncharacterized protein (DUF433 family)/transposase-like protein|nr:DUF433 domain-containing protein [Thermoanaerobaculia bacterium]
MISQEESERLLYEDVSPRDKPRYTLAQAARYLKIAPATLHSWVRGRQYPRAGGAGRSEPLIRAADRLSFSNLIEAHVLRALRINKATVRESGRIAARQLLAAHLRRVEWDGAGLPVRLFPASPADARLGEVSKIIVIDPRLSFGKPVVASRGIRTSAIAGRIHAGESLEAVAQDYRLQPYEVEAAILYEREAA